MAECTHDCSTCGESCGERTEPQSFLKAHNSAARVGKVFGVVSGKGGVGKSMVASQLAVLMRRKGCKVGILDGDITGPSIPKCFGVRERAMGDERGMLPVETGGGIQMISVNLLLDNETDPVLWRGPVIGGVVTQFWTDVILGCGLPLCGYASGNWRCGFECISVAAAGWDYHRSVSSRVGEYGGGEGCEDGGDDGGAYRRGCGEYELSPVSGLREGNSLVWSGQDGGCRSGTWTSSAGAYASGPEFGSAGGSGPH